MKPFLRVVAGILVGAVLGIAGIILFGRLTRTEPVPELPGGNSAVITHVAGPVFVIRGERTISALPGERLEPGDIVKVTEGAVAQVQLADRGSALLGGDTLVRFLKLTGADQQLELRTEILTGSLSYRVEQLKDTESIIIEADGTEFEVRGTEFVIRKSADGTLLLVGTGEVQVTGNVEGGSLTAGGGTQVLIAPEGPPAAVTAVTDENRLILAASAPLPAMPFGYEGAPKPVRVEISVDPPDADIYIDGLKTGSGKFNALLPEGTTLSVRVRRRGFQDRSFEIIADSNQYIDVRLEPSGLEQTLAEEPEVNPLLRRLREDYERRLLEMSSSFADMGSRSAQDVARIAEERRRREAELNAMIDLERARAEVLQTELADSRAENEKLKDLIRQIQELAGN